MKKNRNVEHYQKAVDQIKASDALKEKTVKKIQNMQKQETASSRKRVYRWVNATVLSILILAVMVLNASGIWEKNRIKRNIIEKDLPKEWMDDQEKQMGIKSVGDFATLYRLLEKTEANSQRKSLGELKKELVEDATTDGSNMKQEISQTNIQEKGVGEADFVKNDGNYIYYVVGNTIFIVKTEGNTLELVKEISYPQDTYQFKPREIYVTGDTLLVLGTEYTRTTEQTKERYRVRNKTKTRVIQYNIRDKENMEEQRTIALDGHYLSSRLIGDNLYFLSSERIYWNSQVSKSRLEEELKPEYEDSLTGKKKIDYSQIQYFEDSSPNSYMQVASLDIHDSKEATIKTFLGAGNTIYCSQDKLYIIEDKMEEIEVKRKKRASMMQMKESTIIYQFYLQDGQLQAGGKGEVEGRILNSFSMSQKDGYFRIATTKQEGKTTTNMLSVLDQNMKLVGSIEDLAKGESIYAARFSGDTCYLVTYEQVDPLFLIDLSNPEDPKVMGKLKIPGYSSYLHLIDQNHLLGIGRQTEEKRGRTQEQGLKLSLFDISNQENPVEVVSKVVGGQGTFSEVLYRHKAFLQRKLADGNTIIAFPITIREKEKTEFMGAIFYEIGDNTIEEIGRISNQGKDKKQTSLIERII